MVASIYLTRFSTLQPAVAALESLSGSASVEKQLLALNIPRDLLYAPDTLIPMQEFGFFYENAARFLGIKDLGTFAARNSNPANLGAFGRYTTQGLTLRETFQRKASTLKLYTTGAQYSLSTSVNRKGQAALKFQSVAAGFGGWPNIANLVIVNAVRIIRDYAGDQNVPLSVQVSYGGEHRSVELEEFISASIRYNADLVAIFFPTHLLDQANKKEIAIPEIYTFNDFLRSINKPAPRNIIGTIMEVMRLELLDGAATIDRLRFRLGMSTRSLQRVLESVGTNYRDMLSRLRFERAGELMRETKFSNFEISLHLGYASPSHFGRAFKKYTDMSPTEYRQSLSNVPERPSLVFA